MVDTKLQPNDNLCIVQMKQNRFTSDERTDQRNLILVLVAVLSNEGSGEPVHMFW